MYYNIGKGRAIIKIPMLIFIYDNLLQLTFQLLPFTFPSNIPGYHQ
jgi:hypothetical protein